jgi:hypothetical protein
MESTPEKEWWLKEKYTDLYDKVVLDQAFGVSAKKFNISEDEMLKQVPWAEQTQGPNTLDDLAWKNNFDTPSTAPPNVMKIIQDKLDKLKNVSPNMYKWYMKHIFENEIDDISLSYKMDALELIDYLITTRQIPQKTTDRERKILSLASLYVLKKRLTNQHKRYLKNAIFRLLRGLLLGF